MREVAWSADTKHAALLLQTRDAGGKRTSEIIIVAADGSARARRVVEGASHVVASADRVLVGGTNSPILLDLDAKVVAELPAPRSTFRVREGAGMFAIVAATRAVTLVWPSDGGVIATWEIEASDAVPIAGGALAVDGEGNVSVGCLEGKTIRTITKTASGGAAPVIQLVGDHVVVAGGTGLNQVRVATFASPCKP